MAVVLGTRYVYGIPTSTHFAHSSDNGELASVADRTNYRIPQIR